MNGVRVVVDRLVTDDQLFESQASCRVPRTHNLQCDIADLQLVPPLRDVLETPRVLLVERQQVEPDELVLPVAAQVEPALLDVVARALEQFKVE